MTQRESCFVLEICQSQAYVIGCFGKPSALERLEVPEALTVLVAADERLLLTDLDLGQRLLDSVESSLSAADASAVVVNLTAGFSIYTLRGADRYEAFARLCAVRQPESGSVAQALFAHIPAKIIASDEAFHIVVSSVLAHQLLERVMGTCHDLAPTEAHAAALSIRVQEQTI
jgi:hypothetical protein